MNYLPQEEQAKLALAAQGCDVKSRDRLVETSQGIVHDVARKYVCPGGLELDDLVQVGNIGLLKAVEKFDPDKAGFATCAYLYVRAAISRANMAHSSDGVRRPEGVANRIADVRRAERKLAAHEFDRVSHEAVADEIGRSVEEVADLRRLAYGVFPVSDATPRVGTVGEGESVAVVDDEDEHDEIDGREEVRKLLAVLTPDERDVIEAKFGLSGWEPVPMEDVAHALGITIKKTWKLWWSAKVKLAEAAAA